MARRALRNRSLIVAFFLLALYMAMAVFGPGIAPHDPYSQQLPRKLETPSLAHPLGLDELGRDILSRVLHGCRYTLGMAAAAVALGSTVGVALGSLAGYYGGWLEALIMRAVDGMLAFPGLILAMAVVAVLGPGLRNLTIAVSISSVPVFIRVVRASFLSLREQEFVSAARAVGVPDLRIMLRHILPNAMGPILVQTSFSTAGAILSASGLSFLGLGAQPPMPEWAVMLSRARDYMWMAPHVIVSPGLLIAVAILAMNLLGDGLRDVLDPRMNDR